MLCSKWHLERLLFRQLFTVTLVVPVTHRASSCSWAVNISIIKTTAKTVKILNIETNSADRDQTAPEGSTLCIF